ncbi:MAG: SEC-C domain-containing protein [Spirochaetes bacterium]|nr:SEC-C domain-containing protein [Spirochaetota bacterium]MBU1081577.1 SEC-C domain-containing protein [Spirochaetota bacterium]
MREIPGKDRRSEYLRGKRALADHDPVRALRLLRIAVDDCPASERSELSRRLYWLSVALRRLGKDGLAVKALASAQRLAPRGPARDAYERMANGYGMPKASCSEHDDYRAFCSIQIRRYLDGVPDGKFSGQNEIDAVLTLIADTWVRLAAARDFKSASCDEKLKAFRTTGIDFPALRERRCHDSEAILTVDFYRGRLRSAEDRCSCGSGLPYRRCCGRTRLPYESERG